MCESKHESCAERVATYRCLGCSAQFRDLLHASSSEDINCQPWWNYHKEAMDRQHFKRIMGMQNLYYSKEKCVSSTFGIWKMMNLTINNQQVQNIMTSKQEQAERQWIQNGGRTMNAKTSGGP